jgi:hypothetical protein
LTTKEDEAITTLLGLHCGRHRYKLKINNK